LAAYQVTTKNKEQIDTDPAEPVHSPRQFESEKRGVIHDHHDDRKCAKKIEAGLAFAILKARIDFVVAAATLRSEWRCSLSCGLMNARKLKLARFPKSLAATRRGFTFYVDDPITSIAESLIIVRRFRPNLSIIIRAESRVYVLQANRRRLGA